MTTAYLNDERAIYFHNNDEGVYSYDKDRVAPVGTSADTEVQEKRLSEMKRKSKGRSQAGATKKAKKGKKAVVEQESESDSDGDSDNTRPLNDPTPTNDPIDSDTETDDELILPKSPNERKESDAFMRYFRGISQFVTLAVRGTQDPLVDLLCKTYFKKDKYVFKAVRTQLRKNLSTQSTHLRYAIINSPDSLFIRPPPEAVTNANGQSLTIRRVFEKLNIADTDVIERCETSSNWPKDYKITDWIWRRGPLLTGNESYYTNLCLVICVFRYCYMNHVPVHLQSLNFVTECVKELVRELCAANQETYARNVTMVNDSVYNNERNPLYAEINQQYFNGKYIAAHV